MHAILSNLSRVFGRKKDEKEPSPTTLAPGELLDGKFEAVSPSVSPSATKFLELDPKTNGHDGREKDNGGLSLLRAKSRPSSPDNKLKKLDTLLPHLSLNFPAPQEESSTSYLDSSLDPESEIFLTDNVIGQRRLNPMEALVLIRACSQAIISRGLETLGIMHPHWYSASPDVQRRLISQFLRSLDPPTATSLTPASASPFDSEMDFTSPHDVAAVLRWGLRHLQLEGDSFGTEDGWYKAFLDAESAAGYPPKAFSENLSPKLPPAHLELLTATLEIFSSLAAHSEANSTSGSRLSKIFGLWLLTARRVEDKDNWHSFYARWERTGRMLEHLFLARIREESTDKRMPVRLLDLVRKYPYTHGLSSPTTDLQLLPPSRFTTPHYDALFVRIEIELPTDRRKPKTKIHPLNLLADAFSTKVEDGEFAELWTKITAASKEGDDPSPLSNIFADETIRFLSIVPDNAAGKQEAKSPTFSLLPGSPASPHKRFFSAGDEKEKPVSPAHTKPATDPTPLTPISAIGSDWAQFSSSGFLDSSPAIAPLVSTLFDTDIERTVPPETTTLSRKSSKRKAAPVSRKSVDLSSDDSTRPPLQETVEVAESGPKAVVKASKFQIVQIDEAFVDFWSDSLLDPLTSSWPTFIICKFKSTLVPQLLYGTIEEGQSQKALKWLVLEQVFTAKAPPPPPLPTPAETPITRPASPALSTSGRKRFSFWSVSRTASSSSVGSQKGKKKEKTPKIGEMGELLEEDNTPGPSKAATITLKSPTSKAKKSMDKKASDAVAKPEDKAAADTTKEAADAAKTAAVVAAAATGAVATGALLAAVPEDKPLAAEEPATEKKVEPAEVSDAPEAIVPAEAPMTSAETEPTTAPLVETSEDDITPKAEVAEPAVELQSANVVTSVDEAPVATTQDQPTTSDVAEGVEAVADVETKAVAETEPQDALESAAAVEVPAEIPQPAEPVSAFKDEPAVEAIAEVEPPSAAVVAESKEEATQDPVAFPEFIDAAPVSIVEPPVEDVTEAEPPAEAVVAPEVEEESTPTVEIAAEIPETAEPISSPVVEPAVEVIAEAEHPSDTVIAPEPKVEESVPTFEVPETKVEEPIATLEEPTEASQPEEVVSVPVDEPVVEAIAEPEPSSHGDVIPETEVKHDLAVQTAVEVPQSAEDISAPAEESVADEPAIIATEESTVPDTPAPESAIEVPVEDLAEDLTAEADGPLSMEDEPAVAVEDVSAVAEPEGEIVHHDSEVVAAGPDDVEEPVSTAVEASADVVEHSALPQAGPEVPSPDTEDTAVVKPPAEDTTHPISEEAAVTDDQHEPSLGLGAGSVADPIVDSVETEIVENVVPEDEPAAVQVEADVPTVEEHDEVPVATGGVEGFETIPEVHDTSNKSIEEETPGTLIDAEDEPTALVSSDIEETIPMSPPGLEAVNNLAPQVAQSIDDNHVEAPATTEVLETPKGIIGPDTTASDGGEAPEAEGIDDVSSI